jgi:hypothetical protein
MSPPLVISEEEMVRGLAVFAGAVADVAQRAGTLLAEAEAAGSRPAESGI